jgi:hypothetical protein
MMNRFNVDKAHVVPAQGQSGGLWLLNRNVDLEVVAAATTSSLLYVFIRKT